ncbi:MAG: CSLREA domain-containing protein, partial [Gemmataceae bacterium]
MTSWLDYLRARRGKNKSCPRSARLRLEVLEDRLAPAVFTVTSLGDNVDASDGVLTLREALEAAQANGATADTIEFAVTGTIDIATTLPTLNNVTLEGPGANLLTIRRVSTDPLDAYRLMSVVGTSEIEGVTLANGLASGSGGAAAGGAIAANGNITLRGVHVTGSRSPSEGGGVAVLNGNLIVIDSTFSNNS